MNDLTQEQIQEKADFVRDSMREDGEYMIEKKWGKVCKKCKKRKGTFMASNNAEGGTNDTCKCND